jgi:phosphate:Na+ symporter
MLVQLLGGVGLFLLGMSLLSDGLKAMAGDALRSILMRFVRGPISGMGWGALLTAMVQSSHATTLTTIGFVSAGLLTFPQALGVIFGANIGTTSTGWLVSILGFKVSIGAVSLPIIFVGAMLRLLGRRRMAALGTSLAGFGGLFLGLDMLQQGMGSLAQHFDPQDLPGAGVGGRLLLVVVGVAMTVVMQSSSAAVATTLAALHAGTITLDQAAAMVIGQNIGTSVTAGVAAIGASTAARRTALSHVLFNLLTGVVAFLLIDPLMGAIRAVVEHSGGQAGTAALAAFHTIFNILGVALLLPFVRQFARLVSRIIPERGPALTRFLDESIALTAPPAVATETVRRTAIEIARAEIEVIQAYRHGEGQGRGVSEHLQEVNEAVRRTREFVSRLATAAQGNIEVARLLAGLHAIDHLGRLAQECIEDPPARGIVAQEPVQGMAETLGHMLEVARHWLLKPSGPSPARELAEFSSRLAAARRAGRARILADAASGAIAPQHGAALVEGMLWIDRVGYHLWRAVHHLQDPPPPASEVPAAPVPQS